MPGETSGSVRLCPHCANSIPEDAADCFYCKADFSSQSAPSWLTRDEPASDRPVSSEKRRRAHIPEKFIWVAGMLVVGLIAFFAGGYLQTGKLVQATEANRKQLQSKDQIIQTQEAQLAQTRQQLNENTAQIAEMKAKIEAGRKELVLAQQKLGAATRGVGRLSASRTPVVTRTASRDTAGPLPQPATPRRTALSGTFETTRTTSVYEDPSSNSRVISQIERGTRVNVVGSTGSWLEVRSKRGNPPGYVRAEDVRAVGAAS